MSWIKFFIGAIPLTVGRLGPCAFDNEKRINVYMILSSSEYDMAPLDAVYFIYPEANVVLIGDSVIKSRIDPESGEIRNKGYCMSIYDPGTNDLHAAVYSLQATYGGLYVPFDGILLNSIEHCLRHLEISLPVPVFQEVVHHFSNESGFTESEFETYLWKRPLNDFHPKKTFACAVFCIRYIPKGSLIPTLFFEALDPLKHPDEILTDVLRPYVSSIVMLPFWLIAESKFPDRWATYGSGPGFTDRSTDLHAPRPHRYKQDYWLIISHKLWLPLKMALPSERTIFESSVIALVRQEYTLNLFSNDFVPVGGVHETHPPLRLKSPMDQVRRLSSQGHRKVADHLDRKEIGLSGEIGGYRTFQHVRVVGSLASLVRVDIKTDDTGIIISPQHGGTSVTQLCGPLAEVNSLINTLRYQVKSSGGIAEFARIWISATLEDSCEIMSNSSESVSVEFRVSTADPIKCVTLVAHSANRCHLLERMIASIHKLYPQMHAAVTCERVSSDPGITVTKYGPVEWYSVPYDFGLSRGKSFSISKVYTEFVLVLDDDFTASFATCIECLLLRMKSKLHSALLPFDIIGFPVLEDERAFGAFRGSISLNDGSFAIEPFVRSPTADGCFRVDICPMVFLGRVIRLRTFEWNPELPVGEHEMFFLRNQIHGIQVGVCSDSTFVHFRAPPREIPPEYTERRNRQGNLMSTALADAGIVRTMYLFGKYSHQNERDFQILLSNQINLYSVRDDTGVGTDIFNAQPLPCLVAILSSNSSRQDYFRERLSDCKIVFFPSTVGNDSPPDAIYYEPSAESLHFIVETTRRFSAKYIFFLDDAFVFDSDALRPVLESSPSFMRFCDGPGIVGFSRDFAFLLSHPMVLRNLKRPGSALNPDLLKTLRDWASVFAHELVIVATTKHMN